MFFYPSLSLPQIFCIPSDNSLPFSLGDPDLWGEKNLLPVKFPLARRDLFPNTNKLVQILQHQKPILFLPPYVLFYKSLEQYFFWHGLEKCQKLFYRWWTRVTGVFPSVFSKSIVLLSNVGIFSNCHSEIDIIFLPRLQMLFTWPFKHNSHFQYALMLKSQYTEPVLAESVKEFQPYRLIHKPINLEGFKLMLSNLLGLNPSFCLK